MIRAVYGTFYISHNSIKPFEYLATIFAPLGGDDWAMFALGLCYSGETIQSIRNNRTSRADVPCGPTRDFFQSEAAEMAQFQKKRMALIRERQGCNERHLAGSASTPFAVSLLATPIGIIHE